MKDILVIYHKADFDGIFCREIAARFFGDKAQYIGWDYGDPIPVLSSEITQVYMLDISVDGMMNHPGLVWIDHHKSAIDKFSVTILGYRIDGVAACRLAYQWFFNSFGPCSPAVPPSEFYLPIKADFVDRKVTEPFAVRLAGEYDIWDRRDPRAELFQHGLRSCDLDLLWSRLLSTHKPSIEELQSQSDAELVGCIDPDGTVIPEVVSLLLKNGEALQYAKTHENASIIRAFGFTVEFEGLTFLACNHARFNSHLFTAGIKSEHEGLLGFNYDGAGNWRVSLYGVPGKPDVDLSKIAVKYGGGGHKQACGFKTKVLPFVKL